MDVCIQIGVTDNTRTLSEWSEFCRAIRRVCEAYGDVRFSGGAPLRRPVYALANEPWQTYCVLVSTNTPDALRAAIVECKGRYRKDSDSATWEDSVAWLEGVLSFV